MADLEQFRRQTRAWLEDNCPPEMRLPEGSDADVFWGGRNAKFSVEVPVGMETNMYACAARKQVASRRPTRLESWRRTFCGVIGGAGCALKTNSKLALREPYDDPNSRLPAGWDGQLEED